MNFLFYIILKVQTFAASEQMVMEKRFKQKMENFTNVKVVGRPSCHFHHNLMRFNAKGTSDFGLDAWAKYNDILGQIWPTGNSLTPMVCKDSHEY